MRLWTKETCRQMFDLSQKIKTVNFMDKTLAGKTVKILSAPSDYIEFQAEHEDPFVYEMATGEHDINCIQYNPMKTMIRSRHLGQHIITKYPEIAQSSEHFEFEDPTVQSPEECHPSHTLHQYLCEETEDKAIYVKNMQKNILENNFIRYPYATTSVLNAMCSEFQTILIDIPEQLFRINLANTLTIGQIREIYQEVVKDLKTFYKSGVDDYVTGYDLAHKAYPEIFQSLRDRFAISFLKSCLAKDNILAVVSAPTFVAIDRFWDENLLFRNENKMIERMSGDNEETLIEKHVILDVIMHTQTWNDIYAKNRFIYIDKAENIDSERKSQLKGMFFKYYQKYNEEVKKIIDPVLEKAKSLY